MKGPCNVQASFRWPPVLQDNPTLPVRETGAIVGGLLRDGKGQPHLQYGTTPGDTLRQLTAARLAHLDNRSAGPACRIDYIRTARSSCSISCPKFLIPAVCAGEDPLFRVPVSCKTRKFTARHSLEADGVDLAYLGDMNQLQQAGELPRLKALYLVSYHSNPAGITTSATKKVGRFEAIAAIRKGGRSSDLSDEDAAYRELRFAGEDTPSALTSIAEPIGWCTPAHLANHLPPACAWALACARPCSRQRCV